MHRDRLKQVQQDNKMQLKLMQQLKEEETSQQRQAAKHEIEYQQYQHDKAILQRINWLKMCDEKQNVANQIKNQFEPLQVPDKKA